MARPAVGESRESLTPEQIVAAVQSAEDKKSMLYSLLPELDQACHFNYGQIMAVLQSVPNDYGVLHRIIRSDSRRDLTLNFDQVIAISNCFTVDGSSRSEQLKVYALSDGVSCLHPKRSLSCEQITDILRSLVHPKNTVMALESLLPHKNPQSGFTCEQIIATLQSIKNNVMALKKLPHNQVYPESGPTFKQTITKLIDELDEAQAAPSEAAAAAAAKSYDSSFELEVLKIILKSSPPAQISNGNDFSQIFTRFPVTEDQQSRYELLKNYMLPNLPELRFSTNEVMIILGGFSDAAASFLLKPMLKKVNGAFNDVQKSTIESYLRDPLHSLSKEYKTEVRNMLDQAPSASIDAPIEASAPQGAAAASTAQPLAGAFHQQRG